MGYKISGSTSENSRIIVLNQSDWSLESTSSGIINSFEIDGITEGQKTIIARNNNGKISGVGNVNGIFSGVGNDEYTKLLIHFDDNFVDDSNSTHSIQNNGVILNTDNYKFGSRSGYFNNDYLNITDHSDFEFGSGDFTIDFWFKPTDFSNNRRFFGKVNSTFSTWTIYGGSDNNNKVAGRLGTYHLPDSDNYSTYDDGQFHHYAFVRNETNLYLFIDGILKNSTTIPIEYSPTEYGYNFIIGRAGWYTSQVYIGYFDEFRISKGIARWTENFTPPASQYS